MREITLIPLIQLDQLLKWEGIVDTGGQVRPMLEAGMIRINGEIATKERREKIMPGDIIEIEDLGTWKVVTDSADSMRVSCITLR